MDLTRARLWPAIGAALLLAACQQPAEAKGPYQRAPAAERVASEGQGLQTAVFAGGCFWGVEGVFSHVEGVSSAVSGYHGGVSDTANYGAVTSGFTQHEEAVRIVYDPAKVRYDQLLEIFFSVVADPTLKNRQGPDIGPQYNASIIPMNEEQAAVAQAYLSQMEASGAWSKPIVTETRPYAEFFEAEEKHQDYMIKNPQSRYIQYWDVPKVEALARLFPDLFDTEFTPG